jgi:hypothetical protein
MDCPPPQTATRNRAPRYADHRLVFSFAALSSRTREPADPQPLAYEEVGRLDSVVFMRMSIAHSYQALIHLAWLISLCVPTNLCASDPTPTELQGPRLKLGLILLPGIEQDKGSAPDARGQRLVPGGHPWHARLRFPPFPSRSSSRACPSRVGDVVASPLRWCTLWSWRWVASAPVRCVGGHCSLCFAAAARAGPVPGPASGPSLPRPVRLCVGRPGPGGLSAGLAGLGERPARSQPRPHPCQRRPGRPRSPGAGACPGAPGLVSAGATANHLGLGQGAAPAGSNKRGALPELLE